MKEFVFYLQRFAGNIIEGTDDDESINNTEDNVTISSGAGDDTIDNSSENVSINAGDDNDKITNSGSNVTINAESGKDSIKNDGASSIIDGGAGDDSIENSGDNVSIVSGAGNDYIYSGGSKVTINGGSGNDEIWNSSSNAIVDGGADDDVIYNRMNGGNSTINGGDGNDNIDNDDFGENAIINAGAGDDYISNYGAKVSINGGEGNDYVSNYGADSKIDGGKGNDYVSNYGADSKIDGGKGNDYIYNYENAKNVTISCGEGDDTIYNEARKVTFEYHTGDGKNTVNGFNATSTLKIDDGTGTYSTLTSGSDVVVFVGSGWIVLSDAASLSNINIVGVKSDKTPAISGTDAADSINNNFSNVTIESGEGDDTINNRGANVSIDGDMGNDSIFTSGGNTSINGDDGNDLIINDNFTYSDENGEHRDMSNNVTINGGTGNDTIYNHGEESSIDGGEGDDFIGNSESNVTIDSGTGNDSIYNGGWWDNSSHNGGSNVKINGGDGNDLIINDNFTYSDENGEHRDMSNNVTINGGTGNDTIYNHGEESSIDGGEGDDFIGNSESNVTINGGTGNDSIYNGGYYQDSIWYSIWYDGGNNVTINGGDGNDYIYNYNSKNVSINGGEGNDSIINEDGNNVTIDSGTGDDTIYNNYGSEVTISGGTGNDYIYNSGSSVTIDAGGGNDLIINIGDEILINAGGGNDSILNVGYFEYGYYGDYYIGDSLTIDGGAGKDYIKNDGASSIIDGGDDNDSIYNRGSYNTINGGTGNDFIYNEDFYYDNYGLHDGGQNVLINAGAGNDSINNLGDNVTINGGDGNDYIYGYGEKVKINGGKGNDFITLGSYLNNNLIQYNEGDGNDLIKGFEWYNKLQIGNGTGTYSVTASGNDIIFTVGDGKITLESVASFLTIANVEGELIESNSWRLKDTTATYGTLLETLITVNGVKSAEGLSINGKVVTVAAAALNNANVTVSDGYTLALGSDVINKTTTTNEWSYNNSVATYKQNNSPYYSLASDGKSVSYIAATSKDLLTVNGVKSAEGLSINGKVVTVAAAALNNANVTVSDGYTLALGSDVINKTTTTNEWSYNNSVATYKQNNSSYYSLASDGKSVSYVAATNKDLFTVNGVKSAEGLSINGKVVTVAASALNNANVTISDGYILALGSDVINKTTTTNEWSYNNSVATYKQNNSPYYSLASDGKSVSYIAATSKDLLTVNGVKSAEGLSVSGKVVTIKDTALKSKVSISGDGYEFNFAEGDYKKALITSSANADLITSNGKNISINAGDGNDTIKVTSETTITGGKGNDSIANTGNGNIFVYNNGDGNDYIKDFNETSTLQINGASYSKQKNGDDIIVTVGNGNITLGGAAKLSVVNIEGEPLEKSSWKLSGTTATYGISGEEPIVTVNGVKSVKGLSIDITNKVVTVAISALGESTVTISDDYELAIDENVPKPTTQEATWSFKDTTAICQISSSTAGYMLEENQIKYVKKSTGNTIMINGVTTEKGITITGTVVTVPKAALSVNNVVTVSDGYTLALDKDVDQPVGVDEKWAYNNNTVIYTGSGMVGGHKLVDNQIIYVADKASEHVEIKGVKSLDNITRNGDTFTIPRTALNKSTVTISKGYKLELADDIDKPKEIKAGWTLEENTATYKQAGTSEGYSVENNKIIYTAAKKGKSVITVKGVNLTKGLALNEDDKIVTVSKAALNKTDVTISEGYSLSLGSDVANNGTWKLKNAKATYQKDSTSYALEDNKIVFSDSDEGTIIAAELDGMASLPTFSEKGAIKLAEDNFTENGVSVVSNGGKFGFEFDAGDFNSKFSGNDDNDTITNNGDYLTIESGAGRDSIVSNGNKVSIDGGLGNDKINNTGTNVEISGGAGNDKITLSGGEKDGNIFSYAKGDGNDILYNFKEKDKIKIADGSSVEANIDGDDILFKVGNGSITIKDGVKSMSEITFVDAAGKDIASLSGNKYTADGIIANDANGEPSIVLSPTFKGKYIANSVSKVDGSQTKKDLSIDGSTEGISLIGGAGKDTLISGENEFEMTGGKGNDLFVYNKYEQRK